MGKTGLVAFFGEKSTVLASVSFTCTISINRGDLGTERETGRELLEVDQVIIKEDNKGSS